MMLRDALRRRRAIRRNSRYAVTGVLLPAVAEHARRQGLWPLEAVADLILRGLAGTYGLPEAHRMIAPKPPPEDDPAWGPP